MSHLITKVSYWPDGCDPAADPYNERDWRVDVEWCGPRMDDASGRAVGGYRVVHRGFIELSRAGNWEFHVPRFRRWQYRWATLEEAREWAEKVRNSVTMGGLTYAEWQARLEAKP
jgi:hypothetical protein